VESLGTCPECGSDELRKTKRVLPELSEIDVTVCDVCHWASDPRVGRPPADRSKNVTLRRLMQDAKKPPDDTPTPADAG
jgi:hypothetical protein